MKHLVFFILTVLVALPSYSAGIWFEPYGGIETGNAERGNTAHDFHGQSFGLRLGGYRAPFIFGFEYGLGDFDVDDSDDDLKTTDLGAFFGYVYDPIRLWVTYFFNSEGEQGSTYEGDGGYKIGLGFKVFGSVSLNIEKSLRVYDKNEGNSIDPEYEIDGMFITASLPMSF